MTDPAGKDWGEAEIDLIVEDYFQMLFLELGNRSFVKAHRNRVMQEKTGRSRSSIEFKHQNISAVLDVLGLPWIQGYKPMSNFQRSLIDGVERRLTSFGENLVTDIMDAKTMLPESTLAESGALYFGAPPSLGPQEELPREVKRIIAKFDPAERDARNRTLGEKGEELVLRVERARLISVGRTELARKIRWVSKEDGDGAGFDILSFDQSGAERLLEVKTTTGRDRTPFYITENERSLSVERPDAFKLVRLYDFARRPMAFELSPPLENFIALNPTLYRAAFN